MSIIPIPGGSFDEDHHIYRDEAGVFVPSLTQIISLQGLSNGYGAASPEVLANAARRGNEVHFLAFAWAKFGDVDPTMVTDEVAPYFEAYKRFLEETNFKPDPDWVESPMIAELHGMKFGVTPDTVGVRKPWPMICELKATAAESASWAIQTAAQEMAYFKSTQAGRAKRQAVILKADGKYRCCPHENHQDDSQTFLCALQNVYWRLGHKQKLWEVV